MRTAILAVILICAMTFVEPAGARHQAELESTYLGDGWFQYRLRTVDDPYFWFFDVLWVWVRNFYAPLECAPAWVNWRSGISAGSPSNAPSVYWEFQGPMTSQICPYEAVFLARSEYRHFKGGTNASLGLSLGLREGCPPPYCTINAVGFVDLQALVPCSEQEADGSPSNLLARLDTGRPDVMLNEVIRENDQFCGIRFSYPELSTVQIQATRDFRIWTNVALVYGYPGVTTWTSTVPLNVYGDYFRLRLAAEGHLVLPTNGNAVTSQKQLTALPSAPSVAEGRVVRCVPHGTQIEVQVATEPGFRYVVELRSIEGEILKQTVIAGGVQTNLLLEPVAPHPPLVSIRRSAE